ncbi:hypothetical protein ABG067_007413 [Albugo candida]
MTQMLSDETMYSFDTEVVLVEVEPPQHCLETLFFSELDPTSNKLKSFWSLFKGPNDSGKRQHKVHKI